MLKSIVVCALVAGFSLVSTATFSAKWTVASRSASVNGNKVQTVKTVQKAKKVQTVQKAQKAQKVQTIRERRPSIQKQGGGGW